MKKKKSSSRRVAVAAEVVALPRSDVTDGQIVDAVLQCGGFPSLVADKFSMSMADLLARAKGQRAVAAAFAEARQRMIDKAKARAITVMMGDANTPPDTKMLRWYIERYE